MSRSRAPPNRLEPLEQVNAKIAAALRNGPAFIGRNGSTELLNLLYPNASHLQRLLRTAGIFPLTAESIHSWQAAAIDATRATTICVSGWYEPVKQDEASFFSCNHPSVLQIPLRGLEPYYVDPEHAWTRELAGKRVAVVSSFAETAVKQVARAEAIWPNRHASLLPPDTTWIPIRTGFPEDLALGRAAWPAGVERWQDAVAYVVNRVCAGGADCALIGCGGLGMLIAHELVKRGISAVVMGGAIQVLFGIKGARWQNHSVIGKFWNDAWVWPAPEETPRGAGAIEGGCYWEGGNR